MSMRHIYRKVARKNGISLKELKAEMQTAINDAYHNPPNDGGVTAAYQRRVPCKGEVPAPDELIRYCVKKLKKNESGIY